MRWRGAADFMLVACWLSVAMLLGILALPDTAMAWGGQDHRIIARIAAERLTDAAREPGVA